jgi:Mor family transcriptional regulator
VTRSENREALDRYFRRLLAELGEGGRLAGRILGEELGRLTLHVPSVRTLEREARNATSRREFNGSNIRELARLHRLSPRSVRLIVNGK